MIHHMKEEVANSVRKYRTRAKMTQEGLGKEVGVSRQTIIAIEKGDYTPSILVALKIAQVFKFPVEKIFYIKKHEDTNSAL